MLNKEDWHKSVRRPYPPLFSSLICHGCSNSQNYKRVLTKQFGIKNLILLNHVWYYSKKEIEAASILSFNEWKNPEKLKNIKREFAAREKLLLNSTSKQFEEYIQAYEYYTPTISLVWRTEFALIPKLRELLLKKITAEEIDKLLDVLNIPLQDNFYIQEQFELIHTKNLKQHIAKFEWINSRYGEYKPYTEKQAKEQLKKIDKKRFLNEWRENKKKARHAISKTKKLLEKNDRAIVDLMQFIIYYRTQRSDMVNKSHFLAYKMLVNLAKNLKISYKELIHCTKEEILNKRIPSKVILKDRQKGHALIVENGNISCETGKKYHELQKFFTGEQNNISELKGNIACKGKVKGKVKLIFSTKDFHKIKPGDILVTSMTNPHMLPIMKKAAAFITDEGGITCHAAIISRELRKPCIIGTKIATEVFKDGNMVEVDANTGIIKLIK